MARGTPMRVSVIVTPGAKAARVERVDASTFRVAVTAPAREGRANVAAVEALAAFLGLPKNAVSVIRGAASRRKIVEIRGAKT